LKLKNNWVTYNQYYGNTKFVFLWFLVKYKPLNFGLFNLLFKSFPTTYE